MKNTEITTNEIFAKGQVLTLAKANEMVGKTIAITSPEYRANTPDVRIFTIAKFQTRWEWAAEQPYCNDKFKNYQEYWQSYMTPEQIAKQKSQLYLICTKGKVRAGAETNLDYSFYNEVTFTGSDADREVYYIEIGDIDTSKPKELFYKSGERYSDKVINSYFEGKDGKRFYNLHASYDAKLNIETGNAWSILYPDYQEISFPTINELLDSGLLIDHNYGR